MHGSSPRARGTVTRVLMACPPSRFIPACAGNSFLVKRFRFGVPVHPRVRGEQTGNVCVYGGCPGSSPRARGTVVSKSSKAPPVRFIPACAGNRAVAFWPTISPSVHPRVRGEQPATIAARTFAAGSSPRARGTVRLLRAAPRRHRFIPACAGNSQRTSPFHPRMPVHPRVREEQ